MPNEEPEVDLQNNNTTITRDTPFTVRGDHDGVDTVTYRCTLNGTSAKEVPVSALASGVVAISFPNGLPKGTYTVDILAISEGGEVSDSDPASVCVLTVSPRKPKPVTNVRAAGT